MSWRRWVGTAAGGSLGNSWVWVAALLCSAVLTSTAVWAVQGRAPGGIDRSAGEIEVIADASGFQYPGALVPGGRFYVEDLSVQCSMGWPAVDDRGQSGFFTAAHCFPERGPVRLIIPVRDGPQIQVVATPVRPDDDVDLAFVPVPSLGLSSGGQSSLFGKPLSSEPVSLEWLSRHRPKICWKGQRTGFACGQTRAVSNGFLVFTSNVRSGDSGGPVFAVTDEAVYPVGVTHAVDGPLASATPLLPLIHDWRIHLS